MKSFISKIFKGNGISPPDNIANKLYDNFENAINVDWYKKEEAFEAVFYKENQEYLATFDFDGNLKEYKVYMLEGYLPETIKNLAESRGEIMNAVLTNKGNSINYEIIVRVTPSKRFMITISDTGVIIDDKEL